MIERKASVWTQKREDKQILFVADCQCYIIGNSLISNFT